LLWVLLLQEKQPSCAWLVLLGLLLLPQLAWLQQHGRQRAVHHRAVHL
jgi:hypothetical protein